MTLGAEVETLWISIHEEVANSRRKYDSLEFRRGREQTTNGDTTEVLKTRHLHRREPQGKSAASCAAREEEYMRVKSVTVINKVIMISKKY